MTVVHVNYIDVKMYMNLSSSKETVRDGWIISFFPLRELTYAYLVYIYF